MGLIKSIRLQIAAELMAFVIEEGFDILKAPIKRVTTFDIPIPYSKPLEEFVIPTEERIIEAVKEVTS